MFPESFHSAIFIVSDYLWDKDVSNIMHANVRKICLITDILTLNLKSFCGFGRLTMRHSQKLTG